MTEHILPDRTHSRLFGYGIAASLAVVFGFLMPLTAGAQQPCPPGLVSTDGETVVSPGPSCPEPVGNSATPDYRDPVVGITLLGGRTTINVSNDSQLTSALGAADCGQTIQLASGSYSGTFTLNKTCPANSPVIVKGAAGFTSVVNGTFALEGARNILTGLLLSGSNAGVTLSGTNHKVIANKITGWGSTSQCHKIAVSVRANSSQMEIAYNEIHTPGPWATGGCGGPQARYGIRTQENNETTFPYGGWVHHNYFHDFPTKPNPNNYNSGQDDAMEIGQTQGGRMPLVNSGWYIERNRIENHRQKHGTVDLKVGGVVYRYNTFINTPGRVDLRGSTLYGSIIESNYHRNSGGSTVHGKDHKFICNDFDATIALKAGDIACDAVNPTDADTHAHVCNVLVSGNKADLNVGKVDGADETLPARDTTIRSHTGKIILGLDRGLVDQRNLEPAYQCAAATETTAGMVGPGALSSASSAYKAARGL